MNYLLNNIIKYLNKSKVWTEVFCYVFVILIGFVDYITGDFFSSSIFYLFPVFLVTWFGSKRKGIFISAFAAAISSAVNCMEVSYLHHNIIHCWRGSELWVFFSAFSIILGRLKDSMENHKKLAGTDFLTGVPNVRSFYEFANSEINRANRYKHPFTMAYIDLDNFKTINDRFGHTMGDKLLHLVAITLQKNLRTTDMIARLGGDEFGILLPETDYDQAQTTIHKIQDNISDLMKQNNWPVTLSIGMVTCNSSCSVDEMIKMADTLMYSVKNNGRNMIKHEVFN
ncbi:MAG: GGDEF domain-containing protein [Planctomycetota bacterium]